MSAEEQDTLDGYRLHLKEKLDNCFARGDDIRKRFARIGVTRDIFEAQRLRHFFKLLLYEASNSTGQIGEHRLDRITEIIRGSGNAPSFCNVFAILLYARCKDETIVDWAGKLLRDELRGIFSDNDLPLSKSEAAKAFGREEGRNFWDNQFSFCPVILVEGDETVYVGHRKQCPPPFLVEPQRIGEGAYAIVYKVRIERGHLINRAENSALLSSKEYAQKVYVDYDAAAKKSFEAEGTTIKKFVQSAKSHENILVTKASLEHGGTYSLFFDLAKYSLDDYFRDPQVSITSFEDKKVILGQVSGLAGALAYLHDELYITSTGEQLRCYHLDLKPQNILVFDSDNKIMWKISDFGISQIKRVPADQAHLEDHKHPTSFLDLIFRRGQKSEKDLSSGVDNSRYGGTYAAPEARLATDKVTRTSDVWSLGCVIALVLTFLDDGSLGIQRFASARLEGRDNDRFFESTSSDTTVRSAPVLHNSVAKWLESLVQNAIGRHELEGNVMQRATDLLLTHMLLVDPKERCSAKDAETQLRSIQAAFPDSHDTADEGPPEDYLPNTWQFELPDGCRGCKLTPDGKILGVISSQAIMTHNVSDIRDGRTGQNHPPPQGGRWTDFSLGKKYICAIPESPSFECIFIPYLSADILMEHHVQEPGSAPMLKAATSPNNEFTAFVLKRSNLQSKSLKVVLHRTNQIIESCTKSTAAADNRQTSETPNFPRSSKISDELPWPSLIKEPHEFNLPVAADIVDLRFSSDSKTLMAVTKPYRQERSHIDQYSIFSWDVNTGRRLSTLTTKNEGSEAVADAWRVHKFALFANQPSFAAISKTKIRSGTYRPLQYQAHSRTMADEILDILVDDKRDEIVVIGKTRFRGKIKAFRISRDEIEDVESLERSTETALDHYDPATDCCCIFDDLEKNQHGVLVASINSGSNQGKLSLVIEEVR